MPAPFSPVHIPFVSGTRQDIGKTSQDNPSLLRNAENVLFTKKGHITNRPEIVSRDAQVEVDNTGLSAGLAAATSGLIPSGIVPTGFSTTAGPETPLACWQSKSFYNRNNLWVSAGTHWSLRQTKSAVLRTYDPINASRTNPCPVGTNLVGIPTTGASSSGFPILNAQGEVTSISLGSLTGFQDQNISVSGDALFYIDTLGTARGYIPTTLPAVNNVIVATGCTTTLLATQAVSSTVGPDGFYYVAIMSNVASEIIISRLSAAGSVSQILVLTGLGTVNAIALVHNGVDRLGLAWNGVGSVLKTKVITITAGVMADSGLNLTLTGAPLNLLGLDTGSLVVGLTHNGLMSVMFTTNTGNLYVGGRLFSAATETAHTALVANGLGQEQEWDPLFGAVVVGGHTLVGVMNSLDLFNQSTQWIVMDFTSLYQSGNLTERTAVAAGPYLGAARITPSSVAFTPTSVSFAVAEGLSFSGAERPVPIIRRAGIIRITLSLQGVQAAHVNGVTLLSGQLLHVFDGTSIRPDHFVEEMPFIFSTTAAVAGGSLPAGSFTYQATWEAVNARGQVTRSGASNQKTVVVTAGQKVSVVIKRPQLWNSPSQLEFVRIRLWATQVNPTNNALLYFVTETTDTTPSTGTPITLSHSVQAVGTEETLYETVSTLSDMRAPSADRGIAIVTERAWVADQNRLYVSKLIRPGIAVSWNTEGSNVLTVPAALGTIQGLAAVNEGLVVLGSRAAAVVTGPGVDDTGVGPGWLLQILDGVPGMNESSPRSCTATASGVAFQAQDGDVWLANSAGQAMPLSRQVRDNALVNSPTGVDVVNLISTATTNTMLMAHGSGGFLRVMDLENGHWGHWTFPGIVPTNGLFLAAINGALWMQTTAGSIVYSVDGVSTGNFTSIIETGVIRQTNPTPHGWGRLRSVVLNEVRTSADSVLNVHMKVLADQNDRVLLDKIRGTAVNDPATFPGGGDGSLIFAATSQRCSYFRIQLLIDHAAFDIEGLDVWVANTGERVPSNNRS